MLYKCQVTIDAYCCQKTDGDYWAKVLRRKAENEDYNLMEAILAAHDKLKLILRVLFFSRNYQIRIRILEDTRRHSLTKQSTLCDDTPGFSEN